MRPRSTQALVSASGSLVGVVAFATLIGVLPLLPSVVPYVVVIAALAALIAASFKTLGYFAAAAVGTVVGIGSAFALAAYAMSNI